jgi:acetyl esterase/lipase
MTSTPWSQQPLKTLLTILLIPKILILLPLSLLRFTPKSARPTPSTSLRICVINAVARELFRYWTTTRATGVASVSASHARVKDRFGLARPAAGNLYQGVLESKSVVPEAVGGIWYPSPIPAGNAGNEKVVLHCPGGAFVLAYGTDDVGSEMAGVMSRCLRVDKTFLAQYRVASGEETRFPAALQDLVTFYVYVLGLGVKAENIVLSGDSAAGNLVFGLLRYLEDMKSPELPLPRGVMLWSPWVHVTAQAGRDWHESRNAESDLLVGELLQWGVDAYLPKGKMEREVLPYVSPLHHAFETKVPVFIHAGRGEGFFDQIRDFAQEMDGMDGNRVRFHATDCAPHNLLAAAKGLGMERELEAAARDACSFFEGDE